MKTKHEKYYHPDFPHRSSVVNSPIITVRVILSLLSSLAGRLPEGCCCCAIFVRSIAIPCCREGRVAEARGVGGESYPLKTGYLSPEERNSKLALFDRL
jgi:hypothetical protein